MVKFHIHPSKICALVSSSLFWDSNLSDSGVIDFPINWSIFTSPRYPTLLVIPCKRDYSWWVESGFLADTSLVQRRKNNWQVSYHNKIYDSLLQLSSFLPGWATGLWNCISFTTIRHYVLFLIIPTVSNIDPDAELDSSNLLFNKRKKNKWMYWLPDRVISGYHIQNEKDPLSVATTIIFLKKTFEFSFNRSTFMLPGFLAVFCWDAISPGLSNSNANGSTTCKALSLWSPRMERPTMKKTCSLLFNNTRYEWYQNLSHIGTYLSTSEFVCEHGVHGFWL